MKLTFAPYNLQFIHPFTVSVHSRTTTPIVLIKIEWEGKTGIGESSMPPYLGETQESVIEFLKKVDLKKFNSPHEINEILMYADELMPENLAAKAGLDIALHDLLAKINDVPLHTFLELEKGDKTSSFTVGIDTPEMMVLKTREAKDLGFKILKIKLGTAYDEAIIEAVLSEWDGPFSVDANQGWKDLHRAKDLVDLLHEKGVLFIEQPFEKSDLKRAAWLTERSSVPIIADESMRRYSDLDKVKDCFHGINVKLMKTTGLAEALKTIRAAKELKMKIVTGCMAKSSCAVGAMWHLTSLADWVDLDGPFLVKNDPFSGLTLENGFLNCIEGNGIGLKLKI